MLKKIFTDLIFCGIIALLVFLTGFVVGIIDNNFMAEPTWGLLEKSQVDAETIEEAIVRLITAHNDDANAHIGAGKSLDTHKTQATIDHPADSVVEDKVPEKAITVPKLNFDKFYVHTQFSSVDGWDKSGNGVANPHPGGLQILVADVLNEYVLLYAQPMGGVEWSKNPIVQFVLKLWQSTNQIVYIGSGGTDPALGCFWGFKIVNGTLYACHQKDANEYTTEITGITITDRHIYRAEYTSATSIKFYIDGVLKATHTTNLPENADQTKANRGMSLYLKNTAALEEKEMTVSDCNFIKDL